MGRRKERSGFGRRQVLQLNDSKREGSPYRGQGGEDLKSYCSMINSQY